MKLSLERNSADLEFSEWSRFQYNRPPEEPSAVFELTMLENAIDYMVTGIDELFDSGSWLGDVDSPSELSPRRLKYGILHIYSGFLLLLKERLWRHNPRLIFLPDDGKSGRVRTIGFDQALRSLEEEVAFSFLGEEIATIQWVRDLRNSIEHYQVAVDKAYLWNKVTSFLNLVDRFLIDQLEIALEDQSDEFMLIGKIRRIDSVWKRYTERRKAEWLTEAEKSAGQFKENRVEALNDLEFFYHDNKGAFDAFMRCPVCDKESLIVEGEYAGVCSNEECEELSPLTACTMCGGVVTGFDWDRVICDNCEAHESWRIHRDD